MIDFIYEFFSVFKKSEFIDCVWESGIIITLIYYLFFVIFALLIIPFILLIYPFYYLNLKSKNWFRKDDVRVKVQLFKRSKNS